MLGKDQSLGERERSRVVLEVGTFRLLYLIPRSSYQMDAKLTARHTPASLSVSISDRAVFFQKAFKDATPY